MSNDNIITHAAALTLSDESQLLLREMRHRAAAQRMVNVLMGIGIGVALLGTGYFWADRENQVHEVERLNDQLVSVCLAALPKNLPPEATAVCLSATQEEMP